MNNFKIYYFENTLYSHESSVYNGAVDTIAEKYHTRLINSVSK